MIEQICWIDILYFLFFFRFFDEILLQFLTLIDKVM